MKAIRAAWINDIVGSLGRTPEQEIEEQLVDLQLGLGYTIDVIVQGRGMHLLVDKTVDLLVFDYGGASSSYGNYVWDQFEAMIKWAQEHEGKLVLLFSSFTTKMYENLLKAETQGALTTENILCWIAPTMNFDNDEELQGKASAWFLGGEFEPYTPKKPVTKPTVRLKPPVTHRPPKKKRSYSNKEIWEQCEKRMLSVEMAHPWIENADGTGQRITCFRTFCTDVYEDDNETRIGTVGGGTGFVTLTYKGEEWMIKHSDLWYAFVEALEANAKEIT